MVNSYFGRSPYQRCILELMGFENTTRFLRRYPAEMQEFMRDLDAWDDRVYDVVCGSPVQILNLGENVDAHLAPPRIYEQYLIPYYRKRVQQLHDAGKYCHIHVDGSVKDLLPYLGAVDFDGIEALTPEPQGDATLEEIKDAIGNKVLLDGIPAIMFLPQYSDEQLMTMTRQILELFSPHLILGVSDEFPPTPKSGNWQWFRN